MCARKEKERTTHYVYEGKGDPTRVSRTSTDFNLHTLPLSFERVSPSWNAFSCRSAQCQVFCVESLKETAQTALNVGIAIPFFSIFAIKLSLNRCLSLISFVVEYFEIMF